MKTGRFEVEDLPSFRIPNTAVKGEGLFKNGLRKNGITTAFSSCIKQKQRCAEAPYTLFDAPRPFQQSFL